MKAVVVFNFALLWATFAAGADFSYTTTSKVTGGTLVSPGGANNAPSKYYFKGQKMKSDNGEVATIIDFDAQTFTILNNRLKTITTRSLGQVGAGARATDVSAKVDVRETGQQKTINGFNAKELIMTMDVSSPETQQTGGGKMQMEMDMWLSSDVPGAGELRDFYKRNMDRMPWSVMSGSLSPSMRSGIAEMQRKLAEIGGVQVLSVMKMKSAGGAPAIPQMSPAQQAQMQAAMARMQAMQQKGGPGADAAAQAMARMAGGAAAGASTSMMEITTEASNFSTASIPDSIFAIPAAYQKVDPK